MPTSSASLVNVANEVIELEDGWSMLLQSGLLRLQSLTQNLGRPTGSTDAGSGKNIDPSAAVPIDNDKFNAAPVFSTSEAMGLYSLVYQMCTQRAPHCYTPQLYGRLVAAMDDFLSTEVYSSVRVLTGPALLTELVLRWRQFEIYQRWVCTIFAYLDRYYVQRYKKLPLPALCASRFEHIVFQPVSSAVTAAILDSFQLLRSEAIDKVLASSSAPAVSASASSSSLSSSLAPATAAPATAVDPSALTFTSPLSVLLRQALAVHVALDTDRLRVYIVRAEQPILHAAASYYASLAPVWLAEPGMSMGTMLRRAGAVIDAERALARNHLRPIAERLVVTAVASALMLRPQSLIFALPPPPIELPSGFAGPGAPAAVGTFDDLVPGATAALAASNGPRATTAQTAACFGCGPVPPGLFALFATRDVEALQLVSVLFPLADEVADAFKLDTALRLRAALTVDAAAATPLSDVRIQLPLDPLTGGGPAPSMASLLSSGGISAAAALRVPVLLAVIQDAQTLVETCFPSKSRVARMLRTELHRLKASKVILAHPEAHPATAQLRPESLPSLTELLVLRIDSLMRKRSPAEIAPAAAAAAQAAVQAGLQGVDGVKLLHDARDAQLALIAALVPLAADFDYFSEMYKRALSKRLLLDRFISLDFESQFGNTLSQRCGMRLSQADVLLGDIKASLDAHDVFKEWVAHDRETNPAAPPLSSLPAPGSAEALRRFGARALNPPDGYCCGVDMRVQALTSACWPVEATPPITLPEPLASCVTAFESFYSAVTNARTLHWVHNVGSVVLVARYGAQPLELVMSALQAAVLLQFNSKKSITVAELGALVGLAPYIVKLQLRSLVSGPIPLLLKTPASGYAPEHVLTVNTALRTPHRRVRLPPVVAKPPTAPAAAPAGASAAAAAAAAAASPVAPPTPLPVGSAGASGADDVTPLSAYQRHMTEAFVVRTLKLAKNMTYKALAAKTRAGLPFSISPFNFKSVVEGLISRDFIEREGVDKIVYIA